MEGVLQAFLSTGIPGAAAVALAYVVYHLWDEGKKERAKFITDKGELEKAYKEEIKVLLGAIRNLEERRLDDTRALYREREVFADAIHKQMLDVVKQCTTVLESTASSLEGHKGATLEHRDAQKEAAEELRKLSTLLVTLNEEIKTRLRTPGR